MTPGGAEADGRQDDAAPDDAFSSRRGKLDQLREQGREPYLSRFDVTHRAAELAESYSHLEPGADTGETVTVAGRLVARREQGKVAFLVIRDSTGDLQLFCRVNVLGAESFAEATSLDLGDWVGATGEVLRTRRGELSVVPTEVTLLSKSL
ncbi:MAG: lysine--tRNA ligase, partial [Coriobacteriia bacterium]|nr:lysine--tRNA ligase [Coriobacteriia bacterium]